MTIAVTNYIRRHPSEPIRAEAIAAELFMSLPYLGFSSPAHYTRVFKKGTGQAPSEYRKNSRHRRRTLWGA